MKIIIQTQYQLIGDEGGVFSEGNATTEGDTKSVEDFQTLIDMHTEKLGQREQTIRIQLKDLLEDKKESNDF